MKKAVSFIMSFVMVCTLFAGISVPSSAEDDVVGLYDYLITNPYKDVDFDTWKAYKAATHVHTVRSDGNVELNDMIENYYALGYQGLALTDHGTVNYSWTEKQTRLAIFAYQYFTHGNVDTLSAERYQQITTGSDRGGDGMIEIPLGIELNGSSTAKCHVNSYFADCGHGDLEIDSKWPEEAVRKSQKAGGICHINHVGEWTDGKDDIGTYDTAFVQKYANLFLSYSALIGMELVNTTDNRTHNDRYLYDESLKITAPTGKNIFGFCEDDAHDPEDCGNNAQYFYMPSNTAANTRICMETGAFFACSKNAKTDAELGNGFTATGDFPMVSRVSVDEETNRISFNAYNGNVIKMVSNGEVVDRKTISKDNETITFDLNSYETQIGSYVRFYITGAGGICYSQPFLLSRTYHQMAMVKFDVPSTDTTVTVKNSDNKTVEPIGSNYFYNLDVGTYTYTASRPDYRTKKGELVITEDDVQSVAQKTIKIVLNKWIHVIFYDDIVAVEHKSDFYLDEKLGELPTVEDRVGYVFDGWYTEDGTKITEDTVATSEEMTLYSHWVHDDFDFNSETSDLTFDNESMLLYGSDDLDEDALLSSFNNKNASVTKVNGLITTGATIQLTDDNNEIYKTITVVNFGDTNQDCEHNGMDAMLVNCLVNGMLTREQVGEAIWSASDCNHDGNVNEYDIELLNQAGLFLSQIEQSKTD